MLRINQQKMYYALQIGEAPIYELDEDGNRIIEYTDSEGKIYYRQPGSTEIIYSDPQTFLASISMSGGEAEAVEYGLSTSQYEAVAIYPKSAYPIKEGSLIWWKSPIEYIYGGAKIEVQTSNGEKIMTTAIAPISADYMVLKVSESKNYIRLILKAINK